MRTLTLHTADELVARWRVRAERFRTVWGDESTAHQIESCAVELEAILFASMEMEAAHHGDPEEVRRTPDPPPPARMDSYPWWDRVDRLHMPPL